MNKLHKVIFLLSVFLLFVVVSPAEAKIKFTEDTKLNFSNLSIGDLEIKKDSSAQKATTYSNSLEVDQIVSNTPFVLGTQSYDKVLSIEPVDSDNLNLTVTTTNFSTNTETFSEWSLDSTKDLSVKQKIRTEKSNNFYEIKVNGKSYDSFSSDGSNILSFTYSDGFSSKTFSLSDDDTKPKSFTLSSPVDGKISSDKTVSFNWNSSASPDVKNYKLLIDGQVDTTVNSSTFSTNSTISCGEHTWSVEAVDKASNSFVTNKRDIEISCGSGFSSQYFKPPSPPKQSGGFGIEINNGQDSTESRKVELSFQVSDEIVDMAISENKNFFGSSIESFTQDKGWELSKEEGAKTIYAKFYNDRGISSEVVTDTIFYKESSNKELYDPKNSQDPEKDNTTTKQDKEMEKNKKYKLQNGDLVKIPSNPKVYLIEKGTKRHIPNGYTFEKMNFKWSDIKTVASLTHVVTGSSLADLKPKEQENNYNFKSDLSSGDNNDSVKELQKFLNNHGFRLSESGPGSPGNETKYFGFKTKSAVKEFQSKYSEYILKPLGLTKATGYFGQSTRNYINNNF